MARPERRKTKKVKDQSLVESVAILEESVIDAKTDSNVIDKGFYLDEKETVGFKETIDLPLVEAMANKKEGAPLSQADIQAVQLDYENKLKILEEENQRLKSGSAPLSKNEKKFLAAIGSERLAQDTDWPRISSNKFRKEYKVHPAYFAKSLLALTNSGMIERKESTYSGNVKTYQYSILK